MTADGILSVEALLALALLAILLPPAFDVLRSGSERLSAAAADERAQADLMGMLERFGRDARCACVTTDPDGAFVGRRSHGFSQVSFSTAAGDGPLIQRRVSYAVEGGRLVRSDDGRAALLLRNVARFEVRFYDGESWTGEWGWDATTGRAAMGIRGLPVAVEIRVTVRGPDGTREAVERMPVMTALLNRTLHG